MIEIRQVKPDETYSIRHHVLRPNQTTEACKYDGDYDACSFHFGAFHQGNLIGVGSFYPEKNDCFNEGNQYRLWGMATLEEYRNQNTGSALLKYAEELLRKQNAQLWWCNARISASGFYERFGLRTYGEPFDLHPIGPHRILFKNL